MTKFNELCNSYRLSREKYFNYRNECIDFADKLVGNMIGYFQWPKEQIKYVSPKGNDSDSVYTLRGVLSLEDDTFWHFGLGLTLYESPDIKPYETAIIHILLKKDCEHFIVKIKNFKDEFEIFKDKPEDFENFFEFIFNKIKEDYEKDFEIFFEQEDTTIRKIGFK